MPAPDPHAHLLKVAERCFERYGISRTTMEDIAAEARVSRPTLYRHFGDRESLIESISQRRAAKFAERMRSVLAKYSTLEDQLVEGMLYLARAGHRDQFFSSLVTRATMRDAHQIVMTSGAAIEFATEVWGPVLDAADERGELRGGLDRPLAYQWLTSTNIMLMGYIEHAGKTEADHRRLLREFLVPAFTR